MLRAPSTLLFTAAGIGAVLGAARPAIAQTDINPQPSNVMLLVDSSGSMEYKSSSAAFPTCDPTGSTSEKSRWIELVEVLTGSINNYRCEAVDRSSTAFRNEFSLSGVAPPDWQYVNKYHRPLSGTCTPGPGTLPTNAYDFPANAISYHLYNDPNATCTTFTQSNNGLLDAFKDRMRFGLMTFDSHPHVGTGVSGTTPNPSDGVLGTWSYFLSTPRQGKPAACAVLQDQEVGSRNAAAPPWEGRMVAFGDPNASSAQLVAKNDQIQQILLSLRPYGATPIAGMLDDARNFLWNDPTKDPLDVSKDFGPYADPYVTGGCRSNFIVLLSDGEPNLDLRPFCEGLGPPEGVCPYDKPELIADDLANAGDENKRVRTAVIGFAVSQVTLQSGQQVDCKNLTDDDLTGDAGLCKANPNERQLQACCTLNRIAFNGKTERAEFANNVEELRKALSKILTQFDSGTTSRTTPVFASASNISSDFAASFRFFSSFRPQPLDLWSGVLERQRFVCKDENGVQTPTPQPIDASKGDKFVDNVNSGLGPARDFHSVEGDVTGAGTILSSNTIRPFIGGNSDGLGIYSGTQYRGEATEFVAQTDPKAMAVAGTCGAGVNDDDCRDRYLEWLVGLDNLTGNHRCPSPGVDCNLVGDIFHSTPVVVGPPSALLRDETYDTFSAERATRPLVVYTSTNDGFLHAFKVAAVNDADNLKVETLGNNELWAFMPPAVLPDIDGEYPGTHQELLDGVPVVRDVVANEFATDQFRFERDSNQARTATSTWRTVLVQSFGTKNRGYFAVDITDPVRTGDPGTGPTFLWQLTTDENGDPLFGPGGATPLITTLFFADDSEPVKEVAVAVLPGGHGGAASGASCPRAETSFTDIDPAYQPRSAVNCYPANGIQSRSLTIVRLDNGKVIRTFRRSVADAPAGLDPARVIASNLDSPITGQPVAFPGQTGAISDRVFVADADGTIWRVNLGSTNPSEWRMTMFFDAFPASLGNVYNSGQPVSTPPVLSVDVIGNVTVALSTGDQELLTATGKNYIWSLLEKPDGTKFVSKANWFTELTDGERVTGAMSLFNGSLFFASFKAGGAGGGVCGLGSSRLWGVDYIAPEDVSDLSQGGKARLSPTPGNVSAQPVQFIDQNSPGSVIESDFIIFGVTVAQVPTCFDEPQTEVDPYFGSGGSHTRISSINPGTFQLVMHTGRGGTGPQGGETKVLTFDLPPPPTTARIDSWAAIVE